MVAAGDHSILLVGPQSEGEALPLHRLPGLLPPPTEDKRVAIAEVYRRARRTPTDTARLKSQPAFRHAIILPMTTVREEKSLEMLFAAWRGGDVAALDAIVAEVYPILHARVHKIFRWERRRDISDTTDLLHDLYLKIRKVAPTGDLGQFLAKAVTVVRNHLIDLARARESEKRGGSFAFVTLTGDEFAAKSLNAEQLIDVMTMSNAIESTRERDERMAKHIELRIFFGMTEQEVALALEMSRSSVQREWNLAKRVLLRHLDAPSKGDCP